MSAADLARSFVVDAIDEAGKIRESVANLRELGKRAAITARAAGQMTRARFEGMLGDIAERIGKVTDGAR